MKFSVLFGLAAICCPLAGGLFFHAKPERGPRASGPLSGEIYVWQRVWNEPVQEAVATVPEWVKGLAPLGAEVTWRSDGAPEVAWARVDFAALQRAEKHCAVVLRVGPRKSVASKAPELGKIARELLARCSAGNVPPTELQVDFDCAESQLEDYRSWLADLRQTVAPVAVHPTVLPSWLKQPALAALARESGAYILQVHATEKPRLEAPETALCEAASAQSWVEQAGRIGVPFRVALPTYTYLVGFASDGKMLGITAEGESRVWPQGTLLRAFRPDAAQFAKLLAGWRTDRPACLTGVLWYRLPVATDTLNWRWPTLSAVMAGRAPRSDLRVEKSSTSPVDLTLVNAGEAEEPFPAEVVVNNAGNDAEGDGVGGYTVELRGQAIVFQRAPELAPARLAPGARHPLGWLRTNSEIEIHVP